MKKEEVFDVLWHLWNNVDQAGYDYRVKAIMAAAPVPAMVEFIEAILDGGNWDGDPDPEIMDKARRMVGR